MLFLGIYYFIGEWFGDAFISIDGGKFKEKTKRYSKFVGFL